MEPKKKKEKYSSENNSLGFLSALLVWLFLGQACFDFEEVVLSANHAAVFLKVKIEGKVTSKEWLSKHVFCKSCFSCLEIILSPEHLSLPANKPFRMQKVLHSLDKF